MEQGKSMSLICGALKWLKDRDERDSVEAEKILSGQQQKYTWHLIIRNKYLYLGIQQIVNKLKAYKKVFTVSITTSKM